MNQLILHMLGDYILQSDWMAENKTKRFWPAWIHAFVYSCPFFLLRPSTIAWLTIFGTHFGIDRYRLARYVVWAKNFLGPEGCNQPLADCPTGYPQTKPPFLAVWLLIAADNTLHLAINYCALRWL